MGVVVPVHNEQALLGACLDGLHEAAGVVADRARVVILAVLDACSDHSELVARYLDDVTFDLVSVQYHALKAGHDYGQYVRDAENAGHTEIAEFFRQVMAEDSERAQKCHRFLAELAGASSTT